MAARKATRTLSPARKKKPQAKRSMPSKAKAPVAKTRPAAKVTPAVRKKPAASQQKPIANKKPAATATKGKATTNRSINRKRPSKPAKTAPAGKKIVAATKAAKAPRPRLARDALTTLAQRRAINATLSPIDGTTVVDAYLRDVDHPFKAEIQAVRQIILGATPKVSERIKWNAPSFHYKQDLGAFNPRATEYAHLILLFPDGLGIPADDGWLEGKHKDRREAKFHSLDDVAKKKPALEKLVRRWVALRDA